jgi:hypothetical protein
MIDSDRYMTLGTVDESGPPCVSPVWYVPAGYREFSRCPRPTPSTRATSPCDRRLEVPEDETQSSSGPQPRPGSVLGLWKRSDGDAPQFVGGFPRLLI